VNVFDDIKRDAFRQLDDLHAETVYRIRSVESHQRIKVRLGFNMDWRDIIVTTMRYREARGYFHSYDLVQVATEAAECAIMQGGGKEAAIDAVEREFTRREFRFDGADSPCDEIMPLDYRGWSEGSAA